MAAILVIDDEPQMRRLITRILEGAGHSVVEAANGEEGLALFRQSHPALIITDIVMPEAEGIEMILDVRREASTVPILAISGGSSPLYLRAAGQLGATDLLPKPFSADELLLKVEALLAEA